jgi:hypothetical protein
VARLHGKDVQGGGMVLDADGDFIATAAMEDGAPEGGLAGDAAVRGICLMGGDDLDDEVGIVQSAEDVQGA